MKFHFVMIINFLLFFKPYKKQIYFYFILCVEREMKENEDEVNTLTTVGYRKVFKWVFDASESTRRIHYDKEIRGKLMLL